MRLYFIRDRYLRPTEEGAIQRRFLTTIALAAAVVRATEMPSRPSVEVLQLEVPAAQADLAVIFTRLLSGELPDRITISRVWHGTRRGGLQELIDDAPEPKQRKSRKASTPAPEAPAAQESVDAYWARLNSGSKA